MTELTLRLKQDILDLLEFVQAKKAEEGEQWADSTAAKQCFGHGEFVGILRNWDGGRKSPTLETTLKFERFLVDQIEPDEYEEFLKQRAAKQRASRQTSNRALPPGVAPGVDPLDEW